MAELSLFFPTGGAFGGSGITEGEHETLDTLVHNLSEGATTEILRNSNNEVTDVKILTAPGGTLIRTTQIIRNAQNEVEQTIEIQYDENGVAIQTLTTDINRSGGQVSTTTMVET
jgi:hypothetical protein